MDWGFRSTPQEHLLPRGRVIDLERGKTLGGSSAINYNMQLGLLRRRCGFFKQGSLNYPFWVDQTMQMYGDFYGILPITVHCLGW